MPETEEDRREKKKGGMDSEMSGFLGWSGTILGFMATASQGTCSNSKSSCFYSSVFWWFFGVWAAEFLAHLLTWFVLNSSCWSGKFSDVCNVKFAYFERPGRALWHGHATSRRQFGTCVCISIIAVSAQTVVVMVYNEKQLKLDIAGRI